MSPIQLQTHLRNKFNNLIITSQQIYYWWTFFTQNFYKSNKDYIVSAYAFLKVSKANGCKLCFEKITDKITAIGFIIPLFKKILSVSEVYCDATYKTAKGHFELWIDWQL
ncbi:ATP-dependent DNA helicase pif1 [Gigaspora margarita]|uniref:ATP-dependent DNA helicase pif1 n=1 Tax=Gigaspora margarita TaxID=4874 RepID=A0A8H3X8M2_GIGMA|nr:ATP-dependent DNA helicase pif1 [Gigaspora margarita]